MRWDSSGSWEDVYTREVSTFQDIGDYGEEWFGRGSVVKMAKWASRNIPLEAQVLDVGCGNGHVLLELVENGFDASKLVGVDYAPTAIELAVKVAQDALGEENGIQYDVLDVCNVEKIPRKFEHAFDLVLDKGTFDAITLDPLNQSKDKPINQYPESMKKLLAMDGIFLITSCNWTEVELVHHFVKFGFTQKDRIAYPSFSFGGSTGQTICTVAFHL